MKGITPIISIIILLLITIGLAYAAWTYMATIMSSLTDKNIELPTQKCVNGEDVLAIVHSIGTKKITILNDIIIMNGSLVVSDPNAVWCAVDGTCTEATELLDMEPGSYAKVTIPCCTTGVDCPRTCSYELIISGRAQSVNVYCPGG